MSPHTPPMNTVSGWVCFPGLSGCHYSSPCNQSFSLPAFQPFILNHMTPVLPMVKLAHWQVRLNGALTQAWRCGYFCLFSASLQHCPEPGVLGHSCASPPLLHALCVFGYRPLVLEWACSLHSLSGTFLVFSPWISSFSSWKTCSGYETKQLLPSFLRCPNGHWF